MRPVEIMTAFVNPSEDQDFTAAIAAISDLPKAEQQSVANALEAALCFRYSKKEFDPVKAAGRRKPESFQRDLQRAMALFYTVADLKGADAQDFVHKVVKNHKALNARDKNSVKALVRVIETSQTRPGPAAGPAKKGGFKPRR